MLGETYLPNTREHDFRALVHAPIPERDHAALDIVIPFLEYFGESVERIAFQDRTRPAQLVHADLDQDMLARVLHGESEHEGDGRATEHNAASLSCARHAVVIEMV